MFKFGKSSLDNLNGVEPLLMATAFRALELSDIDFGVSEGLRDEETQREYVEKGLSRTMNSKHLTGRAIDVFAYIRGKARWEIEPYFIIADAFHQAAQENAVSIRWGGAWHLHNFSTWDTGAKEAYLSYLDYTRTWNKTPFIDAPHFELTNLD